MNKKIIQILKLLSLFFFGCVNTIELSAQNSKFFIIKGTLHGLKDNTILYLIHNKKSNIPDTISTTKAKNEKFKFKGVVSLEGEAYFIKIDTFKINYAPNINGYITVLMENKILKLKGYIYNLTKENINIAGSSTHNEYLSFSKVGDSLANEINRMNQESNNLPLSYDSAAIKKFQTKLDILNSNYIGYLKNWITGHPNSLLSPWLINYAFNMSGDTTYTIKAFENLSKRSKNSKYGIDLNERIAMLKNTNIGSFAPNLYLLASTGTKLSLNDITKRGKLTLIDFWATWCAPCRESLPSIKNIYEKYYQKGLNILGVSIDQNMNSWNEFIKKENLPWYNVIEEDGIASKKYGINEIPSYFLLDGEGRIVAKWVGEIENIEAIIKKYLIN